MKIENRNQLNHAIKFKRALNSFMDYIEQYNSYEDYKDVLPTLIDAEKKVSADIEDYDKNFVEVLTDVFCVGNIFSISDSDGISFTETRYYKVLQENTCELICDVISVIVGEYENSVKFSSEEKIDREELITKFQKSESYTTKHVASEVWDTYFDYVEKIPKIK